MTEETEQQNARAEIVLRNMDADTTASVIDDLQDVGIRRDVIRVQEVSPSD